MKIRRLKVDPNDPTLIMAEKAKGRGYTVNVAQTFGTKQFREANALLIVKSVNCHQHLILAMQTILRATQLPVNGDAPRLRIRLALIARYASAALSKANGSNRRDQ